MSIVRGLHVCYNPSHPMSVLTPRALLVSVGVAVACVALYACWARLRGQPRGRRVVLLILRAVLLALLLAAVYSPVLRGHTRIARPPLLVLALDTSRSMTAAIDGDARTRLSAASDALSDGPLGRALRAAGLERYRVGDGAERVEEFAADRGGDGRTDLQAALSEILRHPRARTPAACLLVSDGADGTARPPARVAEGLPGYGVPVYCLGVGGGPPPDVSLPGLVAPRSVVEGEQFELRILARATGLEGRPLSLTVSRDDVAVATRELPPGEVERPATITLTAAGPGYHRYVIDVAPVEGEVTAANNRRAVVVRVEPREARLLLIEGRPRREYAFLRRLLLRIEDLETVILLRKREPDEFWLDAGEPRRASLSATGELRRYRAVVLSNIEAAALGSGLLSRLADYVREGGALAMLGGEDAFAAGGYAGTPLAAVLPVRLASEGMLADPVSARLSGDGELARALRATGVTGWERLPLLDGMNAVAGATPGAEVAMEGISGSATLGPLVIAGRHAAGRALAVTAADTWRWRQSPNADDHSRAAWEALWTTLIGRLIAPRAERQVVLEFGRDSFEAGEPVRALVYVRDADFEPLADARVELTIETGGEELGLTAAPTSTPGRYVASFTAGAPGEYRARATADVGEQRIGADDRRFDVTEPLGELTDAPRPEVLEAIAEATGGRYLPLERADEMAGLLPLEAIVEERAVELRPARTITFFLVLLAIAGADWLLRRRWGVG